MLYIRVSCVLDIMFVAENCISLDPSMCVLEGCNRKRQRNGAKFDEQKVSGSFVKEQRQTRGCKAASFCNHPQLGGKREF